MSEAHEIKKASSELHSIPIITEVMQQIGIDICSLPEVECFTHLTICSSIVNKAIGTVYFISLYFSDLSIVISLLTRPLVSGILFSISALSVLYLVFNTKSLVSILSTFATITIC